MATSNNTLKTRVRMKSDTEENWNKAGPKQNSSGFIPLRGEIIIYLPDVTHDYSRMKVGDGINNVVSLPFLDAGTINGEEAFVEKYASYTMFPQIGDANKLYIDMNTSDVYHYIAGTGYVKLVNIAFSTTTTTASRVVRWAPGAATSVSVQHGVLKITNGLAPELLSQNITVISGIS